ncbi:hypothetical protein KGY14_10265 [Ameyamaea chiangmaiensis]|uniref:Uncharacterized protein n=1 Tax=Ameyamaea chiangmaiensis TaxID=442969 RepID=A0A850P8J3_9PROT|nr:hypothetical protein [Ameyamaea chiangmaiensis]MBS4075576.1 hypothetical protein [Ameyamaea chiangmaiensis]NVN40294.1 hypothetical protein [Ameyamaea chiangmaiensis]
MKSPIKDIFEKAARSLGCNEEEAAWEAKLRKVAKHRPKPEPEVEEVDEKPAD